MRPFHWPCVIFFVTFGLFSAAVSTAQPLVSWDKTLGGEDYEEMQSIVPLPDGIVVGGSSHSNQAFGAPGDNSWDFLIFKTGLDGQVLWQHMYGGNYDERLWCMIATADGGFLAGGYSESSENGDKSEISRGSHDYWLIKMDAQGQLLWDKTFGGAGHDDLFSIVELVNGDILLAGYSNSGIGGDKSEASRGGFDYWLIRCDDQGNKLWDMTLGGDGDDLLNDAVHSEDGFVYLSGGTTSHANTGEAGPEAARGGMDFWLINFDPFERKIVWQHRYGGAGEDFPYDLIIHPEGHIWMGGRSGSEPAPAGNDNNGKDAAFWGGPGDFWLLELDQEGHKIQDLSFGGTGLDDLYAIYHDVCGGLVIGGVSNSDISGNKTSTLRGGVDYWLLGLDENGQQRWQQTLGGSGDDALTKITGLANGNYLIAGHSGSDTGFEKSENSKGFSDFWILHAEAEVPEIDLGPADTFLVQGTTITLGQFQQGFSYEWNTGSHEPFLELSESGTYVVTVSNAQGCSASDSIRVLIRSNTDVYVPNIFSPNDDGYNDAAAIYTNDNVSSILRFSIFDRWGELVFQQENYEPDNFSGGWDGTVRGKAAPEGVYTWYAWIESRDGTRQLFKGDVTILR